MAARQLSAKKPKHLGYTLRTLLSYMGRHKLLLLAVAVLVTVSALANLLGTYMIRPVVNVVAAGNAAALLPGVAATAAIYGLGALSAYGYTQIMVRAAQKILRDIRRDLFAHLQTLPLRFFDTRRHGDVMSYFTNDVDTISDALNNSFAMMIQSFIQVVGTMTLLFILNCGSLLSVGYEKVYLLQNSLNIDVSEVISTYVYKVGILSVKFSYTAAIGLFNSAINFVLLLTVNAIARRLSGSGLF